MSCRVAAILECVYTCECCFSLFAVRRSFYNNWYILEKRKKNCSSKTQSCNLMQQLHCTGRTAIHPDNNSLNCVLFFCDVCMLIRTCNCEKKKNKRARVFKPIYWCVGFVSLSLFCLFALPSLSLTALVYKYISKLDILMYFQGFSSVIVAATAFALLRLHFVWRRRWCWWWWFLF